MRIVLFALVLTCINPLKAQDLDIALYAENQAREVDFMKSIFESANPEFDKKIIDSLHLNREKAQKVRYEHISFTFYYPESGKFVPSQSEMVRVADLTCEAGKISRIDSGIEIPADYVRVKGNDRSNLVAEISVLAQIIPNSTVAKTKFVRRVIVYRFLDRWALLNGGVVTPCKPVH